MKGIRRSQPYYAGDAKDALDGRIPPCQSTVINIEADVAAHERTPLLHYQAPRANVGYGSQAATAPSEVDMWKDGDSSSSSGSSDSHSYASSNSSAASYKKRSEKFPLCVHLRLAIFVLLLFAGFVIATYLLIAESRLPVMRFSLDLVHHDIWSNMAVPFAGLLNYSNVLNIVIMQTGGSSCEKPDSCMQLLRDLQVQHYHNVNETAYEVPYNFLIGGDGHTYEARGWNYQSGNAFVPQNASLVIGFIGDYTFSAPSAMQLRSALSLITESIRRKKLQRQYRIYGVRNLTISLNHGEALFTNVRQWPKFDRLLKVV